MAESKIRNRIISNLLLRFSELHEISVMEEALRFEHFVNYCVAIKENGYSNFDFQDIQTGDSTQGIDGVLILVNGRIVCSTDDLDEALEAKDLNVEFVLIQSKRSSSFNNAELSNLMTFAYNFFSDDDKVFCSAEMLKFISITNKIYENSDRFSRNPKLILYYVTTSAGRADEDQNLNAAIAAHKVSLNSLAMFSAIDIKMCGAMELQQMYQNATVEISATFELIGNRQLLMFSENEATEDEVVGYFLVIPFREYRKLFLDSSGKLKPVFNDNIRDFLGENPVNDAISQTIRSQRTDAFCMLNNGITVIASSGIITGKNVTIKNYQIVNGCQTTHVLFEHKDEEIGDLLIPLRLIVTTNEDLKNQIATATNNQTAVTKEQLVALSTFQRGLEEYYRTFSNEEVHLYYERRTGQYMNDANIVKTRIVDVKKQAKAITAMFLGEPDTASRKYGEIKNGFGTKIFAGDDLFNVYYTSALALYRVENLIRTGRLDKKFYVARYHMIMLFRLLMDTTKTEFFRLNNKKLEKICTVLLSVLSDDEKCLNYFTAIAKHIESLIDEDHPDTGFWRTRGAAQELSGRIDALRLSLKAE